MFRGGAYIDDTATDDAIYFVIRTNSGDTTPCRMTGVTLHSHVHYKEI